MLSITDLFLIPSGSETFGLAALEAMSCGVPVVSSNIGGLPEVNIDGVTGYLCDLADVDRMGDCATAILANEDLHERMSVAARHQAERFEMDQVVAVYENYYQEIREQLQEKIHLKM